MRDYRRYRVPGGAYVFTVNLLERRLDTLVHHITLLRRARRASTLPVRYRCLGGVARPFALYLDLARRRCGFFHALAVDQDRLRHGIAGHLETLGGAGGATRT